VCVCVCVCVCERERERDRKREREKIFDTFLCSFVTFYSFKCPIIKGLFVGTLIIYIYTYLSSNFFI